MPRLFVAVWPSAEVLDHVRALVRHEWKGVRWIPEENWHVTLAFLGEADIDAGVAALASADLPTSRASVASYLTPLGRNSVVVPVGGLDALANAVRLAALPGGSDQPFRGHLTVGRAMERQRISGMTTPTEAPSVAFDIAEVALVASTLTSQGARYDTVAVFPTSVTIDRVGER